MKKKREEDINIINDIKFLFILVDIQKRKKKSLLIELINVMDFYN